MSLTAARRGRALAPSHEAIAEILVDVLAREGRVEITLRGSSMVPLVWSGARLALARSADIAPGDIVLARIEDALYCHRVVRLEPAGWVLRGDARDAEDGIVAPSAILARVDGLAFGRWSVRSASRPIVKRFRASVVLPALPILRGARQAMRAVGLPVARLVGRVPAVQSALAIRMRVEQLRPAPASALARTLVCWGIRPTRDALATWSRRAEHNDGFVLVAITGSRTCGVVAVDETSLAEGQRHGEVVDRFLSGALYAPTAGPMLVNELLRTARERGLQTLHVHACLGEPFDEVFVRSGFTRRSDGALSIALV